MLRMLEDLILEALLHELVLNHAGFTFRLQEVFRTFV